MARKPDITWGLVDWLTAVGGQYLTEIAHTADEIKTSESSNEWPETTVNYWRNSGIPNRSDAVRVIHILNRMASQNSRATLSCLNIEEHAQIFMSSRACRKGGFTPLTQGELIRICPELPQLDTHEMKINGRVHPPPPGRLFGRGRDTKHVLLELQEHPVTLITGIAGNGKTALTWHAARLAYHARFVQTMSWTTDKRYPVGLDGKPYETKVPPLEFDAILRTMVQDFNWEKAKYSGSDLFRLCRDELSKRRYLIIVDNLETVKDSEQMVDQLLSLIDKSQSRALITSREAVKAKGCKHISIGGIEEGERRPYIKSRLQPGKPLLSDIECDELGSVAQGNPLFIQIAIKRYQDQRHLFSDIINDIMEGKYVTPFESLFNPLAESLSSDAQWVARCAAVQPVITISQLRRRWEDACKQTPDHKAIDYTQIETSFIEALAELTQKQVITPINEAEYAMHSLIRAYFKER